MAYDVPNYPGPLCANIDETPAPPFINVEGMEAGDHGTISRR